MSGEPKRRGRRPGTLCRCKCVACGAVELSPAGSQYFRCSECRATDRYAPTQAPRGWTGQEHAHGTVGRAIRRGELAHPAGFRCTDCDRPAQQYDHRDYNRPLQVQPVCRKCNLRRGPAIPLAGTVERLLARGRVPYRNGLSVQKLAATMGRPHVAADLPARLTVDDWHRIWPELIGQPGAPALPEPAKAA